MMVSTQFNDGTFKTTFPFGNVVRHIGHKISKGAIGFSHHAIFIIAVIGGF